MNMKEIWSKNPELILHEIEALIQGKTILSLYQPGHKPIKALIRGIEDNQGSKELILAKKEPLLLPKESCLALYHIPKSPMRAFKSTPVEETPDQLRIPFPEEIVQIQRRKYPRVITSSNSLVTFSQEGSQHINHGIIKDISMDGAKLHGDFSEHIQVNEKLSPVTLTLRLRSGEHEESIVIPEATVRRALDLSENNREIAIHFELDEAASDSLDRYISMRDLEDRPKRTFSDDS